MPPKKKKSLKKRTNFKQKCAIKSRLMQLSLKIDDYIYKKKTISVEDAETFKLEILSFKEKCRNDVRSLQVIDKLTRLLKKIIEEISTTHVRSETYYNPEAVVHTDSLNKHNKIAIIPSDADITQDLKDNNSNIICDKSRVILPEKTQGDTPFLMNNTNITHYTEQEPIKEFNTNEIINSITNLKHFYANRNEESINSTDKQNNFNTNDEISNHTIPDGNQTSTQFLISNNTSQHDQIQELDKNATDRNEESINLTNKENNFNSNDEISNLTIPYRNQISNQFLISNYTSHVQIQELDNMETVQSIRTKAVDDFKESITQTFLENTDERLKTNNISPIKVTIECDMNHINKAIVDDTIVNSDRIENIKRKKSNGAEKHVVKQTSISTRKRITVNNIPKNTNQSNARKNMQKTNTDLSWIENIKYVRDIDADEYDPKLKDLSETFWENCIFPRDWDESDFLLN